MEELSIRRPVRSLKPGRAAAATWMCPSLRESIYRLPWRSVTRLPDIQCSPALAGEHCSRRPQRTPTGHCSCRQAATVIVAAQHRALHPFGQVPTYEEGDLDLFESGAIVFHIAERHAGLLPDDSNARARGIT